MPYMVMFASSTFFAYLASYYKRRDVIIFFSLICILIPSIMGGLRTINVGFDTHFYAFPHFERACNAPDFMTFLFSDGRMSKEILWAALTYFPAKITGSFNFNLFCYQFVTLACVYAALYKHRKIISVPFAWLMYFFVIYLMTYNIMRQSIAAGVIFLGLDHLENRRYGKFLIYVAIGAMFHVSAVIVISYFLAFYMLATWETKHTKLKNFLIYGSLGLLASAQTIAFTVARAIPYISTYAHYAYFMPEHRLQGFPNAALEIGELIICLLYPLGMKRVFSKGDMYKFFHYSLLFHIIYRFFVRIIANRMLYYYDVINTLLLAALPFFIKEKTLKNLVTVVVAFTGFVYFLLFVYVRNSASIWPYTSVL